MAHPDLPSNSGWYGEIYAHEGTADNPFGLSILGETTARVSRSDRSRSAMDAHLKAGGSLVEFLEAMRPAATRPNPIQAVLAALDARAAEHRAMMAKLKGGAA
jgi:hypothetical protein